MGTRSITHFISGEKDEHTYVRLYRQFDGYGSGHGKELAEFLDGYKMVNGYTHEDIQETLNGGKVANGMGCLSAQAICHFKRGELGSFYLVTDDDCWQDFDYYVKVDHDDILEKSTILVKVVSYKRTIMDWSSVSDFIEFCNKEEEE